MSTMNFPLFLCDMDGGWTRGGEGTSFRNTAAGLTEISMITVGKQHLMDYMPPLDVSMVVH